MTGFPRRAIRTVHFRNLSVLRLSCFKSRFRNALGFPMNRGADHGNQSASNYFFCQPQEMQLLSPRAQFVGVSAVVVVGAFASARGCVAALISIQSTEMRTIVAKLEKTCSTIVREPLVRSIKTQCSRATFLAQEEVTPYDLQALRSAVPGLSLCSRWQSPQPCQSSFVLWFSAFRWLSRTRRES